MDVKWFTDRLQQRDTWLGALAVVGALGYQFAPDVTEILLNYLVALGGLIAIAYNK